MILASDHDDPAVRFLSSKQVAKALAVTPKTFLRNLRGGSLAKFPEPCSVGKGNLRWISTEVEAWIRAHPKQKSGATSN